MMKRMVITGTQWGDEGKGKITDYLAQHANYVVRYQGGNNAGHTVVFGGKSHKLHLLPSGILNPKIHNVMANGMVIDPKAFYEELKDLANYKLSVSDRAHIVLPYHLIVDGLQELDKGNHKIGTTKKGIGPAYADKANRIGMRVSSFVDLERFPIHLKELIKLKNKEIEIHGEKPLDYEEIYQEYQIYADFMRPFVTDTSLLLNQATEAEDKILFEGAQGSLLCLDHGTYPYVTSSSPTAASVPLNTGLAPWLIDGALGITKAYSTRVGEGPMPSEITGDLADKIRIKGNEFGTTTGRPRRIGHLDTVVLRHTKRVSGLSFLAVTLLDVLSGLDELRIVNSYELDGHTIDYIPAEIEDFSRCKPNFIIMPGWHEDITKVTTAYELPINCQKYLRKIEELVGVRIAMFSVGPDRSQTILVENIF